MIRYFEEKEDLRLLLPSCRLVLIPFLDDRQSLSKGCMIFEWIW